MMSNQVEVNNNTIDVESRRVDEGLRSTEEEGNLLKNKCGASFKIEEAGNEEQAGVGDETSCFKSGGKVEETGAEDVGMKSGVVLGKDGADVESTLVKDAKEGRRRLTGDRLVENLRTSPALR